MKHAVVFFASDYQIGLSSLLIDEAIALHQEGIPLLCLCGEHEQEPSLRNKLETAGINYHVIQGLDAHQHPQQLVQKIRLVISKIPIQAVHIQNNWQLVLVTLARFQRILPFHIPVVYTLHGFRHNSIFKSLFAKIIIGTALFFFANKVICMSQYLARTFWFLHHKIVLIPLGIPDAFFEETPLPHLQHRGLQIIYPAQFRHGKNQDLVIRAFAHFLQQSRDRLSRLCLPGSGNTQDDIKQLANSLGIANRVDFPGQCSKDRILELYKQHNVAVVASNRETFGQSIVEPFCLGRIVISRPVGIAPDILVHGENGFIFHSEQDLVQIFLQLKALTSFNELSAKTRSKASEFRWHRIASQLGNLYENK